MLGWLDAGCPTAEPLASSLDLIFGLVELPVVACCPLDARRDVNWQPSTHSIARVAHMNAPLTTCRLPIAYVVVCEPSASTDKKQLSAVYAPKGVSIGKMNIFAHVRHKV